MACPAGGDYVSVGMLVPGRLDIDATIQFRCCVWSMCSDPLEITYIPEPDGMLLAGLVALALLARTR